MLSTFIPGLEEFIEETPDQTNIVDPEKEIVIQEAEEAGAKEEQLNNDINNISTALEMCSAKLIELNHVREHLQKYGVDRIKVLEFGEETLESKEVDGTSLVTGLEKAKKFLEDFLPRFEMLQQGALIVEPQVKQEISKMEAEMRKYQDNKEYVETVKQRIEQLRSLIPGYQLCFRTGLTVLRLFHKSTAGLIKAANSMLAGKTSDKKSNNPDEPIDVEAEVVDDDNNHGSSSTKALEYKP